MAVVTGIAAATVSIGRLWLANPDAPVQVLWAEDGLFPLCVLKAGALPCMTEPFAGYLLLAPRLAAAVVAPFPAEQWALAANLLAAVLAGALAAVTFLLARCFCLGRPVAAAVGLLPVIVPIAGLEAVNALGSVYMPLLVASTIAVALRSGERPAKPAGIAGIALLLLLTALTIPLTAVLALVVLLQLARQAITRVAAVVWILAILAGSAAQAITALTAERPREIVASADSLGSFVAMLGGSLPMLVGIPAQDQADGSFALPQVPASLGWIAATVLLVAGIALASRADARRRAAGLLVLCGLVFAFAPSLISGANNRYFVAPTALWVAALLVLLDAPLRSWARGGPGRAALAVIVAALAVAWGSQLPTSALRANPLPAWQPEASRVIAACTPDPARQDAVAFTPAWPPPSLTLDAPTDPSFPCALAWRWQ